MEYAKSSSRLSLACGIEGVGVMIKLASSKRLSREYSNPENSRPAMGCAPINVTSFSARMGVTLSTTAFFIPQVSMTMLPFLNLSALAVI